MYKKVNFNDKEEYIKIAREFYSSEAVIHSVKDEIILNTFNELAVSSEYLEAFFIYNKNNIAGFILLSKSFCPEVGGKIVWIEELYIREKYRRLGLAKKTIEFINNKYDAIRFRLEVEKENSKAKALYEKLGFSYLEYEQMKKDL